MILNFKDRPLSWSQISSFEYSPEKWYSRYILNEKQKESDEMKFGKEIGKRLETDSTFLPQIERLSKMEYPFKVEFGGLPLVGYADSFCDITFKKLKEFKTGKKEWNERRVREHGQIDMYLLCNLLQNKIKPEDVDVELVWLPTENHWTKGISFVEPIEKNIKTFKTKRTTSDITKFKTRLLDTVNAMQAYVDKIDLTQ